MAARRRARRARLHGHAFEEDRERDATLVAAGLRVVRVTWRRLTRQEEREAARFRARIAALNESDAKEPLEGPLPTANRRPDGRRAFHLMASLFATHSASRENLWTALRLRKGPPNALPASSGKSRRRSEKGQAPDPAP